MTSLDARVIPAQYLDQYESLARRIYITRHIFDRQIFYRNHLLRHGVQAVDKWRTLTGEMAYRFRVAGVYSTMWQVMQDNTDIQEESSPLTISLADESKATDDLLLASDMIATGLGGPEYGIFKQSGVDHPVRMWLMLKRWVHGGMTFEEGIRGRYAGPLDYLSV